MAGVPNGRSSYVSVGSACPQRQAEIQMSAPRKVWGAPCYSRCLLAGSSPMLQRLLALEEVGGSPEQGCD